MVHSKPHFCFPCTYRNVRDRGGKRDSLAVWFGVFLVVCSVVPADVSTAWAHSQHISPAPELIRSIESRSTLVRYPTAKHVAVLAQGADTTKENSPQESVSEGQEQTPTAETPQSHEEPPTESSAPTSSQALISDKGEETSSPEEPVDALTVAKEAFEKWAKRVTQAADTAKAWQSFLNLNVSLAAAYRQAGMDAYDVMNYVSAYALLSVAYDFNPNDLEVVKRLGFAAKEVGEYERARKLLEYAAAIDPEDPYVWWWLGDAQRLLGEYARAYDSFVTARDLAPPLEKTTLQAFVDYTNILMEDRPSWEAFEQHRDFAKRHENVRRTRRMIAELLTAVSLAPVLEPENQDSMLRRANVFGTIGIQYVYIKEYETALVYYERAERLYAKAGSRQDEMVNCHNRAVCYSHMAYRDAAARETYLKEADALWVRCADIAKEIGRTDYLRYVQGCRLADLAEWADPADSTLAELREANRRELPRSGPITDFGIAAAIVGEIVCRMKEQDFAGARPLLEMVIPFYENSAYLIDLETAVRLYLYLSHVFMQQEHPQDALRAARAAVELIKVSRRYMDPDAFLRGSLLRSHRYAYVALARALYAVDRPKEAFRAIEEYRDQLLRAYLGARVDTEARPPDYEAEKFILQRSIPMLEKDIEERAQERDTSAVERLTKQLNREKKRLEELNRGLTFLPPQELNYKPVPVVNSDALAIHCPEDTVLISYAFDPYGGIAGVLEKGKVTCVLLPEADDAVVDASARSLITTLCAETSSSAASPADMWNNLGRLLIDPLTQVLSKPNIVFESDSTLVGLPLDQLPLSDEPLFVSHGVTYTIGAAPYFQARMMEPSTDPVLRMLISSAGEHESASVKPSEPWRVETFTGGDATEERLYDVHQVNYLHISAALEASPFDLMLSGVQLASSGVHDGTSYAAEWLAADMPLRLVVLELSGADALARVRGDGVSLLANALRAAGVQSVLLNVWEVPTAARAAFYSAFYKHLGENGGKVLSALEATKRELSADWGPVLGAFQCYGYAE